VGEALGFALSADGRRVACQISENRVTCYDIGSGASPRFTRKGGCHNLLDVHLATQWLALKAGKHLHLLIWDKQVLEHTYGALKPPGDVSESASRFSLRAMNPYRGLPQSIAADPKRFISGVEGTLLVVGDCFGQVAVFDREYKLIAMFFAYQHHLAAWMPDGTCYGSAHLTGSLPTPRALERIGKALWDASQRGLEIMT
jgi:hypothetical protein